VGPTCQSSRKRKGATTEYASTHVPTPFGPAGPSKEASSCGVGGSGLTRQIGPAGLNSREGIKNGIDFEFQRNLEFGKTLRNSTRRFRRNLDMRIFLNSFRLLKDS
jgi:hypothetical protein